jgi:hypothetical protein
MKFERALTMRSITDIVKLLFEYKIPTPGEYRSANGNGFHDLSRVIGIWQNSSVLRILEDERYIGTYVMGKTAVTEIGGRRVRRKPKSEWFIIPNHHPAIVSRELFEQANAKIRRFKCPKTQREYTLSKKVLCGCCRHAMHLVPRKKRAFYCRYTKVNENAECYRHEIGEQELENLLFDIINKQAQVVLNIDGLGDTSGLSVKVKQQAEREKQINNWQEKKRNLYELFILGEMNADAYKADKAEFDTELKRLNHALEKSKAETAVMSAAKESDDELRKLADATLGTDKLTRSLADLLIEKVYVYPGNHVEIVWKFASFGSIKNEKGMLKNVR